MTEPIPLSIVTGFLGSGKTTLIRRYLARRPGRVGIVVNEFGEIGLDQMFFVHATEHLELMASGCLCCARRADISRALHQLVQRARQEGAAGIDEALIETSGMADPAPIISTILQDPWLRNNVRLKSVVAVFDAVNGLATLAHGGEAVRQLAMADRVVITKADLRAAAARPELETAVRELAPDAELLDSQDADFDIARLVADRGPLAPAMPSAGAATVAHGTRSFVLRLEEAIDWPVFTVWLSALLHRHGDRILRVKGMVRLHSTGRPLVIHGVQHIMYPPVHLEPEDATDQPGGLVFITRGIDEQAIRGSLSRFLSAAAGTGAGAVPPVAQGGALMPPAPVSDR